MKPDLSIVIVNWNVRDLLRSCLTSIHGSDGAHDALTIETIVVDNASTDGSAKMVSQTFPQVTLIANADNRGFTGGNNQVITISQGRYVLLLNPDTEVLGDALARMVAYMDAHPETGALGPMLLNPDGSVQSSRRRFPTPATAFIESTALQNWFPHHRLLRDYYVLDKPDDVIGEVDWVDGACLLARREALEQVGLLDDGYFMYSEELDWCRRAKAAGWEVIYYPPARVVHYRGQSSEQVKAFQLVRFNRSKIRYFHKYHGAFLAALLRAFLLMNYAYQLCLETAKWIAGHKRHLRRQRMHAYWQVLKSGL
ncbi:MAG: glycosyltransferase family 2 protein [Anaerolineae bacterium]|nr:MAG: glycosyltransferase family 2 protein [Anaerolineae bacterium]